MFVSHSSRIRRLYVQKTAVCIPFFPIFSESNVIGFDGTVIDGVVAVCRKCRNVQLHWKWLVFIRYLLFIDATFGRRHSLFHY